MRNLAPLLSIALAACGSHPSSACREASDQVNAAVRTAAAGCSTDADCVSVNADISCVIGCSATIVRGHEEDFARSLQQIDREVCAHSGCGLAAECVAGGAPACIDGSCRIPPLSEVDAGSDDLDGGV
jgi:hypothetical protein